MSTKEDTAMAKDKRAGASRRDFLRLASVSAPALAAAAVTGKAAEAQAQAADPASDRLQDTAHTRAYYDSARF